MSAPEHSAGKGSIDPADQTSPKVISAMAAAANSQKRAEALSCQADIHMGFFFDGFGRNRDVDDPLTSRYSNICRLWEAHRENRDRRILVKA